MKHNLKVGDKLKCEIQSVFVLEINQTYEIVSLFNENGTDYYYVRCNSNLDYYFSESQLFHYFNAKNIIRRRKLEQLNLL